MILTDSHLHTAFSSDSGTPMESMVCRAIELGLTTICFTEHYDPDFPEIPSGLDFSLDFDAYQKECCRLQEKYEDSIEILHGIELGIQPHLGEELHRFYDRYGSRFDFIIGSCHLVERMDPYYPEFSERYSPKEGMRRYFETTYENLTCYEHFQAAGHLDYVARYIKDPALTFSYEDYADILDAILLFIIEKNKALEINTAGLKAGLPWPNPHMDILKRYRDLGGTKITIGSDGHIPEHMAYDFDRLPGILKEAGFDHYELYRGQKAFEVEI